MQTLSIKDGWVHFREPENVPERLRREVLRLSARGTKYAEMDEDTIKSSDDDFTEGMVGFMGEFTDAVILCLVTQWSYTNEITKDGLLDLPGYVYDELRKFVQPLIPRLLVGFQVDPDPKAPTDNS